MKIPVVRACVLALVLAGPALAADTNRVFKVHPVGFADAEVAEQMARGLVGTGGNVVLDERNNRLLVFATEAEHAQLDRMSAELNVPPKNVRIRVDFAGAGTESSSGFTVRGAGGAAVGPGGDLRGGVRLSPGFHDQSTQTRENVSQELLVASGREGMLRVGQTVPYLAWINDWGLRWGAYREVVQWQDVGAFLAVQPTVMADGTTIRIRVTPELSGTVEGRPHRVRYTRAASEVVIAAGQTVSLGGLGQDKEFYSRFLVGMGRGGAHHALDIRLTPTLVETAAPPAGFALPAPPAAPPSRAR